MDEVSIVTPNSSIDLMNEFTNITDTLSNELKGLISAEQFVVFTKTSLVFWILISLFGICSNVFNIRTFIRMVPEDSVTLLFLALSISDFAICSLAFGEAISSLCDVISWEFGVVWSMPPNIPRLYCFTIRRILSVMTVLITSFLAIQRCLCVVMPFRIKGMFSRRLTFLFLAAAFIFAGVPYCMYVAQYKVIKYFDPETEMVRYKLGYRGLRTSIISFVSIGMGIVLNVTAQVVINVCIYVMAYGLKKSVQFRKMASSSFQDKDDKGDNLPTDKISNKERQALIQVAIVSIIFVITNSPFLLVTLAVEIWPEIDLYSRYRNLYIVLYRIMTIVEIINSAFNIFVYYNYNSRFKQLVFQSPKAGQK